MKKVKPEVMLVVSVAVLLAAYGLGLVIKNIRFMLADMNSQPQVTKVVQPSDVQVDEPVQEAPEIEYVVVQETEEEFPEEPIETPVEQRETEPTMQWAQDERFQNQQFGGNMQWNGAQQWFDWANNLTDEQRARLQQGMMNMWQRWQNMSFEEAEAERFRMMEMGQIWWDMNDQERQVAMERMQQQFQDWLESDEVELPEFTFDY